MRWSQSFLVTLREVPGDAEVVSHQLLYRAGFIQKLAAGVYSYTPFGFRSLRKMTEIVREEMDATGALEVEFPILQPKELWVESGRWDRYQSEGILFHLKDRKDGEFALAPTAEEAVTDMVRRSVTSWRQLPFNLYQIRTKFRDEIRPRFGLLRGREFLMKDAYSFDLDQKGLDAHYVKMDAAYRRIFDRCGLEFAVVQADSGAIGGSASEEFMVVRTPARTRSSSRKRATTARTSRRRRRRRFPSRGRGRKRSRSRRPARRRRASRRRRGRRST